MFNSGSLVDQIRSIRRECWREINSSSHDDRFDLSGSNIDNADEALHLIAFDVVPVRDLFAVRRPASETRRELSGRELFCLRFRGGSDRDDILMDPTRAIGRKRDHLAVRRKVSTATARQPGRVMVLPNRPRKPTDRHDLDLTCLSVRGAFLIKDRAVDSPLYSA